MTTTIEKRASMQRKAKKFWDALSRSDRFELGDQLVLGDFDWRDWMDEKPAPGFWNSVDELRINWEIMDGRGGKRRHGSGKGRRPHLVHVKDLRNKIVRYEGKLWRVDSVSGNACYIRPLENSYGFGCKTVAASDIHDKVEGGKRRAAPSPIPAGIRIHKGIVDGGWWVIDKATGVFLTHLPASSREEAIKKAQALSPLGIAGKRRTAPQAAPLGSGGRFAHLKAEIAARGGVRDPGALAAAIGRRKYGKRQFQALAAAGRRSGGKRRTGRLGALVADINRLVK